MGTGISLPEIDGPTYALVIGVSRHLHGHDGTLLNDEQFPNLTLASKDAADFAEVLTTCAGFPRSCVTSLCDEQATLSRIKDAFEDLRRDCRRGGKDPTVVVFFAGHGWADPEGRHFLVPYDAQRNTLYRTGLRNRELRDRLADLNTDKLVVFIDACHSGAMAEPGARGRLLPQYDAEQELGGGSGQFVIASCQRSQNSYEWPEKKNGIFTFHLIDLLKGDTNAIMHEDITPLRLFTPLADRVSSTARLLKKEQEPFIVAQGSNRIVLAKNKFVIQERLRRAEARRACGRVFSERMKQRAATQRYWAALAAVDYAQGTGGMKDSRLVEFYGMLEGIFDVGRPDDDARFDSQCDQLNRAYEDGIKSAVKDARTQVSQVTSSDGFVPADPSGVAQGSSAPPDQPNPARPQTRLQLSADDREYVVVELESTGEYLKESKVIRDKLREPVSLTDFERELAFVSASRATDASFAILLQDAASRFRERWSRIGTARTGILIIDKNKDA
jgi:uncharacterized caspase-like protein